MKINHQYQAYLDASQHLNAKVSSKQANKPSKDSSVQIEISEASRKLLAANSDSTDVQSAKVLAIKNAIKNGTYQVSPERIADSMIAQMNQEKE